MPGVILKEERVMQQIQELLKAVESIQVSGIEMISIMRAEPNFDIARKIISKEQADPCAEAFVRLRRAIIDLGILTGWKLLGPERPAEKLPIETIASECSNRFWNAIMRNQEFFPIDTLGALRAEAERGLFRLRGFGASTIMEAHRILRTHGLGIEPTSRDRYEMSRIKSRKS